VGSFPSGGFCLRSEDSLLWSGGSRSCCWYKNRIRCPLPVDHGGVSQLFSNASLGLSSLL